MAQGKVELEGTGWSMGRHDEQRGGWRRDRGRSVQFRHQMRSGDLLLAVLAYMYLYGLSDGKV